MRLLPPADFGLFAMVVVFTGFAMALADFGLASALVQLQNAGRSHEDTAFVTTLVTGLLLTGLFYGLAGPLAAFYDAEPLVAVTRLFAPVFVLQSFSAVPMALMQRSQAFGRMATADLLGVVVGGAVGVLAASRGLGVTSLVLMQLGIVSVTAVAALSLGSWRPGIRFSGGALRELVAFGGGVTGFRLLNYWARQADNLLIGRFMGTAALGFYSRAYSLILMPMSQIAPVVSRVMFPVLSSLRNDRVAIRRTYTRVVSVLAMVSFPLTLGMLVTADTLVPALFGDPWARAIPIIRILAVAATIQVILNPAGWLYMSQGRTDRMFQWGVLASTCLIAAIVVGVLLGTPEWVATCYVVANALLAYPALRWSGDLVGLAPITVLRAIRLPLAVALTMAGIVWALGVAVREVLPVGWLFGGQVVVGAGIYVGTMLGARPEPVRDVLTAMRSLREPARPE
jgi:PST family polysaccharide transporter